MLCAAIAFRLGLIIIKVVLTVKLMGTNPVCRRELLGWCAAYVDAIIERKV